MSARLYVHPHTAKSLENSSLLASVLAGLGYDMGKIQIYHHAGTRKSGVYELVRPVGPVEGGFVYQGFDGAQFVHPTASPVAA